jgi:two-component system sensor histidine kinase BaeS
MRLSLVRQTVMLLVATVLLAVSALGAVVAWNLRSGFADYLRLQDDAWLQGFADIAARAVARQGLAAISGPPGTLRPLFEAADSAGGAPRRPPWRGPPPGMEADATWPHPPPPQGDGGLPVPPDFEIDLARPPPGAQRFANRLFITAPDGRRLAGRPLPATDGLVNRPIVVQGQTVAIAHLAPGPPVVGGVDAAFLARQYRGILLAAGLLMLPAVAGAVWVGRRWARPVQEAQQAARRIAAGALDTRLVPRGNDELADLAHDINAMAQALQQLEASRRRWIAELSHEMRTPLAVLRGEVECLIDGVRPLDAAALLSLQAEVARLTRLVEDFHQLALSDLRALPCTFAPLDAAALVREAAARVAARAAAAGLALTCDVNAAIDTGLAAEWDRQRIEQLLANVLENSLRYTNAPGTIRLALATGPGQALITLDDSAPGVPAGEMPRLFDPLYRADPSRSRLSGGSGLGLAICRAIVRSHGGRIEAAASAAGGLCVTVMLPLRPGEALAA